MSDLLYQLGIDWKLLVSQGVNFFILLAVLTSLVWRPLLALMRKRQETIMLGLRAGEEAKRRLSEIDAMKLQKMSEAEKDALALIMEAEQKAEERKGDIIKNAERMTEAMLAKAEEVSLRKRQAEEERLIKHARSILRNAVAKAVDLHPDSVDDQLITEALRELKARNV